MKYKIPLFDLNFDKKEEDAVLSTIRSGWISTGSKTQEFEQKFVDTFNVKYAVGLSNCTSALHLSLLLLNVKEGDEVICPSLTFVATVNSIRYVNAVPVFCDIKGNDDLSINPELIEKLITKKTKAIVIMHYAGFPCQMDKILEIADKYKLKVIEDSCHAPFSEHNGKKLGTIGDIGCFSFFSNKNISTAEGGMILTNNKEIYEKAKLLRSHGMTSLSYDRAKGHSTSYDVVELGFNYRMDDIRASIGIVQFDKALEDIKRRKNVRNHYIKLLKDKESIIIPYKNYSGIVSNYIMPIVLLNSNYEKRNKIRDFLHKNGIQTSIHYPSVHKFSIYKKYSVNLPVTEYISHNEISLPMYGDLKIEQIEFICNVIENSL